MKKRLLSSLLAALMLVGTFSACNQSGGQDSENPSASTSGDESKIDTSEEVKLKFYFIGDEGGETADGALDALNEKLKEKINATLDPLPVSWGDWSQKLPVIMASGESYDLIYTANWAFYFTEGVKGAFKELDDLLPTYAPKTYEELEEMGYWDAVRINGKICMVPATATELTSHEVVIREDLRKKYGVQEIETWDDLGDYMQAIKENESSMLPYNTQAGSAALWYNLLYENDWGRPVVGGDKGVLIYNLENGDEVFSVVDTPEYEEFVNRQRDWYNKGYWSKSILSEKTLDKDQFLAGASAVTVQNFANAQSIYTQLKNEGSDWELGIYTLEGDSKYEQVAPANNGTAIGRNSQNPERALMFLEECFQNEEIFDLLYYGVEGVNYEINEEGRVDRPEGVDGSANLAIRNLGMGINVAKFRKPASIDWPEATEMEQKMLSEAVMPDLAAFVVNTESISAEIAAMTNVCTEYKVPLDLGAVDPAEGLPALRQKLKEAGIDKVIEEINKQLDEFNANR